MTTIYVVVTVNDDTPKNLEYGDYRGLVVLDDRGECLQQVPDLPRAARFIGKTEGVAPNRIDFGPVAGDPADGYDGYGQAWDVEIDRGDNEQ